MVIDGKKIAEEVITSLGEKLRGKTLGLVVGSTDTATESFVRIKSKVAERLGVTVVRGVTLGDVLHCDGIIVQLPHPDADALLAELPGEDVDAVGPHALVRPPVAEAVREILERAGVGPRGTRAVVLGAGRLVGVPAANLLREMGAHVTVVTTSQGSVEALKEADIVVSGVGEPGLITPPMLKPGVVLIDAGTSEAAGKLAGDATAACAEVASVFTPVPGGVGPIAVAMIFRNLHTLLEQGRVAGGE